MNNIVSALFSFQGRMRRRDFWLACIALWIVNWILQSIVMAMSPPVIVTSGDPMAALAVYRHMSPLLWIVSLLMCWPSLAVGTKRCHDRGKSGWWQLLWLIPILGWIWLLIDLGFLDGTPGPNKYGPSPKGLGGTEAAVTT